jgi:dipeptidyl aminopeptidase/acylaminoacyl peptidase
MLEAAVPHQFIMAQPGIAPYGSWRSPITSDLIVAGSLRLGEIRLDGEDIYWSEGRPTEGGRNVVVRQTPDGQVADVTPETFNVRSRVHEYGGGAYIVDRGVVYFSNFADQRLYRQTIGEVPQPLTPDAPLRYADAVCDRQRQRLICVREDHRQNGSEPVNEIVAVDFERAGDTTVLVSSQDFYSSPRLSPDGTQLAWLSWNHPQMPWDGTELWLAAVLADGSLGPPQLVAGGLTEAVQQPLWSPDGVLTFISDHTGWWNLYRWQGGQVQPLWELEAEFGVPHWVFAQSTFGYAASDRLVCTYAGEGRQHLVCLDPNTGAIAEIETPYTQMEGMQVGSDRVVLGAGSPTAAAAIASVDLATGKLEVLRRASPVEVDSIYLSVPEEIAFPTTGGLTAYAFYYPPHNADFVAPPDEKPPLLVKSHGGPTAATSAVLDWRIQYWTSRGIAVLDVNYGGSTGYGRAYRERLRGQWGIVDVEDCIHAARYLVERGWADGDRLAIDGGSAGGYTTLAALAFHDTFKAGASYYGVSDLEVLARDTHKFEARYLDSLVGPYPDRRDLYLARSPIHAVDRLSCPVIFFQGDEDEIVPPNQAELMVEALRTKGLPVAYVLFEGEQHGFRQANHIRRALDGELYFYSRIFGFELADAIEPIPIENLPLPETIAD